MTHLRILATVPRGAEFATADAINALGGLAVVPRRVEWIPAPKLDFEYRPFLPNFLFLSLDDTLWHRIHNRRKGGILHNDAGHILAPPRRQLDILPRTWGDFTGFAERAEMECEVRMEKQRRGMRVKRYRPGDMIRIVGEDLIGGQLHDKLAKVLRIDGERIVAQVQGMDMMGKPVTATLDGQDVEGWAAE